MNTFSINKLSSLFLKQFLTILPLLFLLNRVGAQLTLWEFDLFSENKLPNTLSKGQPYSNAVSIVYADELTINDKTSLKYNNNTLGHHLVLFANKLILSAPLLISTAPFDTYMIPGNIQFTSGNIILSVRELVIDKGGKFILESSNDKNPNVKGNLFGGIDNINFKNNSTDVYLKFAKDELQKSLKNSLLGNNVQKRYDGVGPIDPVIIYDDMVFGYNIPECEKFFAFNEISDNLMLPLGWSLMSSDKYESESIAKIIQINLQSIEKNYVDAIRAKKDRDISYSEYLPIVVKPFNNYIKEFLHNKYDAYEVFYDSDFMFKVYTVKSSNPGYYNENISLGTINNFDLQNSVIDLQTLYSKWVIQYMRYLLIKYQEYKLLSNKKPVFQILNKINSLKESYHVSQEYQESYLDLLKQIAQTKKDLILPLTVKHLSRPLTADISLMQENNSQTIYALPTDILISPITVNGQSKLGYMEVEPTNPDKLTLYFTGKLCINTYAEQTIKKDGLQEDQTYSGLFKNCDWKVNGQLPIEGLDQTLSYIHITEDQLEGKLVFNSQAESNLTLVRLCTGMGVKLPLTWTYKNDNTFSGRVDLNLSFTKLDQASVKLINGNKDIQNLSIYPVTVTYYIDSQNKLVTLDPGLKVSSGAIASLPQGEIASKIPIDACEYELSVANIPSSFHQLADFGFSKRLLIDNDLGERKEGNGYLRWVELEVRYTIGDKPVLLHKQIPPKQELLLQIFSLSSGDLPIEISGRAVYEQGYQDLKTTVISVPLIHLSKMLN